MMWNLCVRRASVNAYYDYELHCSDLLWALMTVGKPVYRYITATYWSLVLISRKKQANYPFYKVVN